MYVTIVPTTVKCTVVPFYAKFSSHVLVALMTDVYPKYVQITSKLKPTLLWSLIYLLSKLHEYSPPNLKVILPTNKWTNASQNISGVQTYRLHRLSPLSMTTLKHFNTLNVSTNLHKIANCKLLRAGTFTGRRRGYS